MPTEIHYFQGPVRWAKVWKPDERYGYYGLEIKLDEAQMAVFDKIGLKQKVKDDGWVAFKRRPESKVWVDGVQRPAGAPTVTGVSQGTNIGNDSICTVKVSTYTYDNAYGKGTGHRLDAVKVESLVEFSKEKVNEESLQFAF